jgi:hypothetical protein
MPIDLIKKLLERVVWREAPSRPWFAISAKQLLLDAASLI